MGLEQYAQISNYSVASATVVVALAFLAHVAEWGFARQLASEPVLTTAGDSLRTQPGEASEPADDLPARSDVFARIGVSLTTLSSLLLLVGVLTRWVAAQRVPWGNMYEFGIAGSLIAMTVYLAAVRLSQAQWLGGIVTGFALVLLGMSMSTYVPAGPLVPALDSYWLVIHVAAVMMSGALFLLGGATSVIYLVKERAERRGTVGHILARFPSPAAIDKLSYQVHAIGFPIWTFGSLISGPIWAQHAWGRYWGWDPKEVWAFITWVIYAGYLHARATGGWRGKRAAILALVGFLTFLFSYYGINLWGSGLHSYAK